MQVRKAKEKCYPEGITSTDSSVKVPLQNLINHTVARLLNLITLPEESGENHQRSFTLLMKYGFDGSGNHSQYALPYKQPQKSYANIISTFISPIALFDSNSKSVIWYSNAPNSKSYLRPVSLEYEKETKHFIIEHFSNLQTEIKSLTPFKKGNLTVKYVLLPTMFDGKTINAITKTSSSNCYLCGAKPSSMNAIPKPKIPLNRLQYGMGPLHLLINTMEYVLHIAYRLSFKKWQARGAELKNRCKQEKSRIQKEFKERLGLRIDTPATGGGNTNTGKYFILYKSYMIFYFYLISINSYIFYRLTK